MSELKQTTNAGTIDDPIPQELVWKDAQGKFYKVAGTGGSSVGGGEGLVKELSDAIDDDRGVNSRVAATPLAVKTVNDKIGELGLLATTNKGSVVEAINELFDLADNHYISKPVFIQPMADATNVSVTTIFSATPFKASDPSLTRLSRIWQLDTSPNFDSGEVFNATTATDMMTLMDIGAEALKPNTKYYVRCADMASNNMIGAFGSIEFTTGDNLQLSNPTVTVKGLDDSDKITTGLKVSLTDIKVVDPTTGSDSMIGLHSSTDYVITQNDTRATEIWAKRDCVGGELTAITIPENTLQHNTSYTLSVTVKGKLNTENKPISNGVTVKQFTTVAAPKVEPPVITIDGTPDQVSTIPTINGGVFSVSNGTDTHAATELKILLSENMSEVYTVTVDSATTSIKVPSGKLKGVTQYKAQMRYKGTALGWSEWSELSFTTKEHVNKYNYIGVPGTSTFGVGLASEKDYNAVQLAPAEHCLEPDNFQYGLYIRGNFYTSSDSIAMKWIPKFYIKQLQKNEGTVNLNDEELKALLPHVEVTLEQMKEAQRRSPHNALVVAPAEKFTNEADANAHGFYLMRGFIDGGKEYNGFFISNTLAIETNYHDLTPSRISQITTCIHLGEKSFGAWGSPSSPNPQKHNIFVAGKDNSSAYAVGKIFPHKASTNTPKENIFKRIENTPYRCCSGFAWAVISILSLIQGQYATNTNDCGWYDSSLLINYPKGINNGGASDIDDNSIKITPTIDYNSNQGNVFVQDENMYRKTTHNGSINGITNVNGWAVQCLIGIWGGATYLLRREYSIYDITSANVGNKNAPYYESQSDSMLATAWGGDKSSLPDLSGDNAKLFGIYSVGGGSTEHVEFGKDKHYRHGGHSLFYVGGYGTSQRESGIFYRASQQINSGTYTGDSWDNPNIRSASFRAMAYPRQQVTVTANAPEATPSTQSIKVDKGTTLGEAKKKLVTPTATNKVFKEWRV